MTPARPLLAAIVATMALRLALAWGVGVGNDEAYHALLATHLDWSYFDHPPMVALIGRAGLTLGGGSLSPFSLRIGFVALFAGSMALMARLTDRLYGDRRGVVAAIALAGTGYFGLAAGTFALPDGPLLFFSLLTLDRLAAAIERPGRLRPWAWVGLAWGGAMLSKYHAAFLPVGALGFLLTEPSARGRLREPGPWIACGIGLALFSPVIAWNALHGWASFAFQAGRANGSGFRPASLAGALAGQAVYVFPWIWAFLAASLARMARRRTIRDRFLLWQAVPPLATFLIVASRGPILPHWALPGLVPLFPALAHDWSGSPRLRIRLATVATASVLAAVLFVAQSRCGLIPAPADPTAETFGWDALASEIRSRGLLDGPAPFVFTSKWYDSGQIGFALDGRAEVACYAPRGGHAFDLWTDGGRQVGRDGLLVVVDPCSTEPAMYDRWFARIEPVGSVAIRRGGRIVRSVRLYRCSGQTRPFPGVNALAVTARRGGPRR